MQVQQVLQHQMDLILQETSGLLVVEEVELGDLLVPKLAELEEVLEVLMQVLVMVVHKIHPRHQE